MRGTKPRTGNDRVDQVQDQGPLMLTPPSMPTNEHPPVYSVICRLASSRRFSRAWLVADCRRWGGPPRHRSHSRRQYGLDTQPSSDRALSPVVRGIAGYIARLATV